MTETLARASLAPVFDAPRTTALGLAGDTSRMATLGVVNYLSGPSRSQLRQGLPELDLWMAHTPQEGFAERWTTALPVERGEHDGIVYAHDGETLFCAGHIAPDGLGYSDPTRSAYVTALGLADWLGYPELFRMWNFIERINEDNADGLEVYRDFCRGRAEAFDLRGVPFTGLPAATGIGSLGGGIAFYFLATRAGRAVNIENSRQVSAYRYPREYGPRSPSFARGTYLDGKLYVSGTASIIGHRTIHEGDLTSQLAVAFDNIEHLVGAKNLGAHGVEDGFTLADVNHLKIYVRHREHVAEVREACLRRFPFSRMALFNVDICRADLLVEIEGIAQ